MKKHLKNWAGAVLFCAGILLAGSDGPYFPIPNLIGIVLFALVPILTRSFRDRAVACGFPGLRR